MHREIFGAPKEVLANAQRKIISAEMKIIENKGVISNAFQMCSILNKQNFFSLPISPSPNCTWTVHASCHEAHCEPGKTLVC